MSDQDVRTDAERQHEPCTCRHTLAMHRLGRCRLALCDCNAFRPVVTPPDVSALDAEIGTGWQPIASYDYDTAPVVLRPHSIWGAMDVKWNPTYKPDFPWLSGDITNTWPEMAFLPFWMPLPAPPGAESGTERDEIDQVLDNMMGREFNTSGTEPAQEPKP